MSQSKKFLHIPPLILYDIMVNNLWNLSVQSLDVLSVPAWILSGTPASSHNLDKRMLA